MDYLKQFFISFSGLSLGKHEFQFTLEKKFFNEFESSEITEANLTADVILDKKSTMLELTIHIHGDVSVMCDICTDDFNLPVSYQDRLIVKFGEEEFENTEEIIILPPGEHELMLSQPLYEFAHLALPARRVHPEGTCNEEMLKKIKELSVKPKDDDTDPRWDELKKLKLN